MTVRIPPWNKISASNDN